jgi:hypothetical protein
LIEQTLTGRKAKLRSTEQCTLSKTHDRFLFVAKDKRRELDRFPACDAMFHEIFSFALRRHPAGDVMPHGSRQAHVSIRSSSKKSIGSAMMMTGELGYSRAFPSALRIEILSTGTPTAALNSSG